jgi:hypothetical protein
MSNRKQRKEIDKAVRNIINFANHQPEWQQRLDDMFSQMFSPAAQTLGIEEDELLVEIQDAGYGHMVFGYIFEEFSTALWNNEELSFIDEYLKRRGWREAPRGRRYLHAINDSEMRLWEITDVKPGLYAEVRPYGSTETPIRVAEKSATESLHKWQGLAGRVIKLDNTLMFTGALLPLPPAEAEHVQRVLDKTKEGAVTLLHQLLENGEIDALPDNYKQQAEDEAHSHLPEVLFRIWIIYLYQAINRTMPIVKNRDGEAFQPTKVRFPIKASSEELILALDDIPALDRNGDEPVWTWFLYAAADLKEGESTSILGHLFLQEKTLILEVNSSERAQRYGQWLAEKLGNLVGKSLTMHEKMTKKIGNTEPIGSSMHLNHTEEGQNLIKVHLDKHYRQTLDEPIPMLNNKTPRECAAHPKLHKNVILWLKHIESESTKAPSQAYDFSWMWEDLNLVKYK